MVKETLLRFERMLKTSEPVFFDLDTYERVTVHYTEKGQAKAFKACGDGAIWIIPTRSTCC